ncbi:MAG: cytochrome c oxidase subunit II [Candidatus Rokubacteria bacterium]|nr:cytochrome c oxidase subunit II [Candidatus Rokubacteria bacterium]
MSTVMARSDFARAINEVYGIITWVTIGIFVVVAAVLLYVIIRYRERDAERRPRQIRGHSLLEIGWTIAPALVLLIIAIPTIQIIFRTQSAARPAGALEVDVRGHQWWWEFRYPSLEIATANELHLPVGQTVYLKMEGPDVIHSFWVPRLGGKRDVIPGRINTLTFTPEAPGEYLGQCAEFCGISHANMRMRVIVHPRATWAAWVADQQAVPATAAAVADGAALFARSACVGCHTILGVSAGVIGPDLTHFGSRGTVAAGILPSTLDNVAAWVKDPQALKPGVKMPALGLTDEQARAVAAYLLSLK